MVHLLFQFGQGAGERAQSNQIGFESVLARCAVRRGGRAGVCRITGKNPDLLPDFGAGLGLNAGGEGGERDDS